MRGGFVTLDHGEAPVDMRGRPILENGYSLVFRTIERAHAGPSCASKNSECGEKSRVLGFTVEALPWSARGNLFQLPSRGSHCRSSIQVICLMT